jgi:hypothetical protein
MTLDKPLNDDFDSDRVEGMPILMIPMNSKTIDLQFLFSGPDIEAVWFL